jgi:hypothetical protein
VKRCWIGLKETMLKVLLVFILDNNNNSVNSKSNNNEYKNNNQSVNKNQSNLTSPLEIEYFKY